MDSAPPPSDKATAAALGALDKLRSRILVRTHERKAPRWLATQLLDELRTALEEHGSPPAHSRFEMAQTWYQSLPKPSHGDDSNTVWDLAYKNVDDAIRTLAKRLAQAGDKGFKPKRAASSGCGSASVGFNVDGTSYVLRVSGPLHHNSGDDNRETIRFLPEIISAPIDDQAGPISRRATPSIPLLRRVILALVLSVIAGVSLVFAPGTANSRSPITAKIDTFSSATIAYDLDQPSGVSPVCPEMLARGLVLRPPRPCLPDGRRPGYPTTHHGRCAGSNPLDTVRLLYRGPGLPSADPTRGAF